MILFLIQVGLESSIESLHNFDDIFFSDKFLEPRPLLKAVSDEKVRFY